MRTLNSLRAIGSTLAVACAVVLCSSCGTPSTTAGDSSTRSGPAAKVPDKYRGKTIEVAMITGSLPLADRTTDQKGFQGVDYDILQAVGEVLDVKFNYTDTSFDNMIPGVSNRRYQVAAAAFYDTAEREKVVDMVTYMTDGAVFVTHKDKPQPADLTEETSCGLRIGVNQGGAQAKRLPDVSKKCVDAGKNPIEIQVFPTTSAAVLALTSHRIDAYDISASIGLYVVTQNQALVAGKPFLVVPVGFVLHKGSDFAEPLRAGIDQIIADGAYDAILKKWGLQAAAIKKAEHNPKSA